MESPDYRKLSWKSRVGRRLRLAALALTVALGCSDEGATLETLRASGFTRIQVTGWSLGSCSDSDTTCTGFEAVGPAGIRVHGAVGCGWFMKGCTVRVLGTR